MSNRLTVEGVWPSPVAITKGWSRGSARPWNDDSGSGHLRILRGNSGFVEEASQWVAEMADGIVFSPALYPASTRVWKRAGYRTWDRLLVMERGLFDLPSASTTPLVESPAWGSMREVDDAAFEGFWRMGETGLAEAAAATPESWVVGYQSGTELGGFAIVGFQRGVSFLQRIAVRPEYQGKGIGSALLDNALNWAQRKGARTMILNVREESSAALNLYHRAGFSTVGTKLEILAWERNQH